jgi:hypothetical protein
LAVRLAGGVFEFVEIVPVLVAVGSGDFPKVPNSYEREKKTEVSKVSGVSVTGIHGRERPKPLVS